MALLVVDRKRSSRQNLNAAFGTRCGTCAVGECVAALDCLQHCEPTVVLTRIEGSDPFAVSILRWRTLMALDLPLVVLLGPGAWPQERLLLRLGASAVRHWPGNEGEVRLAITVAEQIAQLRARKRYPLQIPELRTECARIQSLLPACVSEPALLACCRRSAALVRGLTAVRLNGRASERN